MTQFDYVVIGAGSAGCVNRLTEDPETTVLLLEAATGYQTRDSNPSRLPKTTRLRGGLGLFPNPTSTLARSFVRGKVLGAPVRLMACSMFEVILTIMTTGRSWETPVELQDVLPYFKKSDSSRGADAYHGLMGS